MTVGGGGVEALFYRGPITPGDTASWAAPGVLQDGGTPGTGVSIGGTVTGGTQGSVLFVGPAGVLAQDNAEFFWDDTNFILKAGTQLQQIVNGAFLPAIFPIFNVTGPSWYVGNSGNLTATGYQNVGLGDLALGSLTTGARNFGLGSNAGASITSGVENVCVGVFSLGSTQTRRFGTAVGHFSLGSLGNTGDGNTGIGYNSLGSLGSGGTNVAIGYLAGDLITSGSNNVLIGGWEGPAGALSSVIAFSDGAGNVRLDYGNSNASTWTFSAPYMVTPVAVASLPAAGIAGRRHFVTDANATTFASIVAAGGTNKVPVYDDGTNWRIG